MPKLLRHLQSNAVAYVALFVALGGTSYAATSLPRGSVGTRALKNHSVTPIKFDRRSIAGYVRGLIHIGVTGQVMSARPAASVAAWNPDLYSTVHGVIQWTRAMPNSCVTLATTTQLGGGASAVSALTQTGPHRSTTYVSLPAGQQVGIAIICPQP